MTEDGLNTPALERNSTDDRALRTRRWLYPLAILLVVGCVSLANWMERTSTTSHMTEAVTALVDGVLDGTATEPTELKLRWANDALKAVFRSGIVPTVTDGLWTVTVQLDEAEADGTIPVTITGPHGAVVLGIRPTPDSDTALICSVSTAAAPQDG